jgi:hypothetical protein
VSFVIRPSSVTRPDVKSRSRAVDLHYKSPSVGPGYVLFAFLNEQQNYLKILRNLAWISTTILRMVVCAVWNFAIADDDEINEPVFKNVPMDSTEDTNNGQSEKIE